MHDSSRVTSSSSKSINGVVSVVVSDGLALRKPVGIAKTLQCISSSRGVGAYFCGIGASRVTTMTYASPSYVVTSKTVLDVFASGFARHASTLTRNASSKPRRESVDPSALESITCTGRSPSSQTTTMN